MGALGWGAWWWAGCCGWWVRGLWQQGVSPNGLGPCPLCHQSSLRGENATVFGCLNHEVPLASSDNASVTCETGRLGSPPPPAACRGGRTPLYPTMRVPSPLLSLPAESLAGFLLSVNATASLSRLRIPYPQTGSWYLSLRSLCATEHG